MSAQSKKHIESLLTFLCNRHNHLLETLTASSVWISLGVEWSTCFHAFIHSVLPVLLGSLPIVAGPLVQSVMQIQTVEKFADSFVVLLIHRALKTFVRNMVQRLSKRLFKSTGSFQIDKILVFGQWHDLLRQMKAAMPSELKHCPLDGPLSQRCEIIEEFRYSQWYIIICLPSCKYRYS